MILKKVLATIQSSGLVNASLISQELGIPRSLVEYAIEQLKTNGYIASLGEESHGKSSCRTCLLKSSCSISQLNPLKLYIVTEKGQKLLESRF